jgi:Protein of unknown function (DUF3147)
MRISANLSALRKTKRYEYAIRFVFGGAITAFAGVVAKEYGPVLGGLFLAFPAIFPASATLLERHERERKKNAGIPETIGGMQAAALDAYGAGLSAIGLLCFAIVVWQFLRWHSAILVPSAATVIWTLVSILLWRVRITPFWP